MCDNSESQHQTVPDHDHSYPDPAQLRAYAQEPMPFHEITASDLQVNDDGSITVEKEAVTYEYRTGNINVETAPEEWDNIEDVNYYDMDHTDAAERVIDWQIEEDFLCVTEFVTDAEGEPAQFEAYWILDEVRIGGDHPSTGTDPDANTNTTATDTDAIVDEITANREDGMAAIHAFEAAVDGLDDDLIKAVIEQELQGISPYAPSDYRDHLQERLDEVDG